MQRRVRSRLYGCSMAVISGPRRWILLTDSAILFRPEPEPKTELNPELKTEKPKQLKAEIRYKVEKCDSESGGNQARVSQLGSACSSAHLVNTLTGVGLFVEFEHTVHFVEGHAVTRACACALRHATHALGP